MERLREFFGYEASLEHRIPRDRMASLDRYLLETYHDVEKPLEWLRRFYTVKRLLQRILPEPLLRPVLWALRRRKVQKLAASGALSQPTPNRPAWPVDETLEQLKLRLLAQLADPGKPLEILWFWPQDKRWVFVITHDVESARGLDRIPRFTELEERYGFRSSFHLVPFKYQVPEDLVKDLWNRGFEVGIHGYNHDGFLFLDAQEFEQRLQALREIARRWRARGFRSPSTLRRIAWLQRLPLVWDSSCFDTDPFEPQPGGVYAWFPYRLGPLVELPITLPQDHLVFRLLGHRNLSIWQQKALRIRSYFGMVLINVHPDPGYMSDPDLLPLYEEFLAWMRSFGAELWNPLPGELADWWNHRLDLLRENVQDREIATRWGPARRVRVQVVQEDKRYRLERLP